MWGGELRGNRHPEGGLGTGAASQRGRGLGLLVGGARVEGPCGLPSRKGSENGGGTGHTSFGGTVDHSDQGRRQAERLLVRQRQRPGDRTGPWG